MNGEIDSPLKDQDMITIEIGDGVRTLSDPIDIDENWVNQQINRRKDDRAPVCVRVTIHEGSVNMVLLTADCGNAGGRGRPPNAKEQSVFDLWDRVGMGKKDFHGGTLIAFLKQLHNTIG